jgi:hypothetical protein
MRVPAAVARMRTTRGACDESEEVLVRTLWLAPGRVSVTVSRGEVTLAGMLDSKADAELVEHFVERVPGVVAVRSDLRWEVDDERHHVSLPGRRR